MRQGSLESFLPPVLAWAVRVVVVGLAAAVAHFTKRTDEALAAGVIGSLLISPYGSPADFVLVVYIVAQMLVGPDSITPRSAPFMVIGGLAWLVVSTMTTTRGLVSIVEFALLLALLVGSVRRGTQSSADAQLKAAPGPIG